MCIVQQSIELVTASLEFGSDQAAVLCHRIELPGMTSEAAHIGQGMSDVSKVNSLGVGVMEVMQIAAVSCLYAWVHHLSSLK
jgi:hypothetical protein